MRVVLNDYIDVLESGSRPKGGVTEEGDVPSLGAEHLNGDGGFNFKKLKMIPRSFYADLKKGRIEKNDILVVKDGATTGKVSYVANDFKFHEATINEHLFRIKTTVNLHSKYLFYILISSQGKDQILQDFRGATVGGISRNFTTNIKFPLPSLETQKKIAEILDKADALLQQDKRIIEKYDQLTQSVFLDMFGDPVLNTNGFKHMKLKEVCTKITDGTHYSPPHSEEGYPYVTAKHIKSHGLDFKSNPTFISEEYHIPIYKRCNPEIGDILYIKDGATTGIAALNTYDCEISLLSSLALLKPNYNLISNYYLMFWLNNERVKNKLISANMSGVAIKRYTLTKINEFELLVPPIELQNRFAEIVKKIEKQKQLAQKSLGKSEQLFQSFLQRAFKGELV